VPLELTIIAVTALLTGVLLVAVMLAGRPFPGDGSAEQPSGTLVHASPSGAAVRDGAPAAESTLRVVWWLTITIVLLGVGLTGSFGNDQGPIFLLGAVAVGAVVGLHEIGGGRSRGRLVHLAELVVAIGLIAGLLALTGFASSPFAMLFALVAVAAALAFGPRAGLIAAGLSSAAFAGVLLADPGLASYAPSDALRLSIGLGATWLLAFVAVAYAGHQRRTVAHAIALSRTDPLTNLFNRSQLFVTLEREISRTRRSDRGFCVLMIDLDGLKTINDREGHLRGDEVLRSLGTVITGSIRAVDSAYRYGGDEFVVLLPETDIVGAFVVAEKIRSGAEEVGMALTGGDESVTSVSIGLVSHPEDGLSAEELMAAADRAMYQAKRLGKNQISGNPRPRPALLGRRAEPHPPAAEPEKSPVSAPVDEPPVAAEATPRVAPPAAPEAVAPPVDRAVAVELGAVVVAGAGPAVPESEEDEADPQEVRRRIVAASRSFDPDHQIRRAMDAFFSPAPGAAERERPKHDA